MTAIGAIPEGIDETEVARRVAAVDPDVLALYTADVRAWIVGPYTGDTPLDELRVRAAVIVDVALRAGPALAPGVLPLPSGVVPGPVSVPEVRPDPAPAPVPAPDPAPAPVTLSPDSPAPEPDNPAPDATR